MDGYWAFIGEFSDMLTSKNWAHREPKKTWYDLAQSIYIVDKIWRFGDLIIWSVYKICVSFLSHLSEFCCPCFLV